jgi:hypothetical protein
MKNTILVRLVLCILLVGSLFFGLQIALGDSPTPPICPIGTQGAPNLRDPHIASGSLCRGACGLDCDTNRCNNVADVTIPVTDSAGNQFICVYKNVVECSTHDACRTHDLCYDRASEAGETDLTGVRHQQCNQDCINKYDSARCAAWTGIGGGVVDYFVNPPFDANRLPFSDPPSVVYSWSGTWDTNWGDMVLQQSGIGISGTYTHDQGKIVGALSGNKLTGTWSEAPSYSPTQDAGDVVLTLSDDGKSFSGEWRYGSTGEWSGDWTGTRK